MKIDVNEVKQEAIKLKEKIKPSIWKKIITIIKIVVITFVSLSILILVVGKIVLSSEKLQNRIKLEAGKTLDKEIRFENISPALIGVKIKGLEISKAKTFDGSGSLIKIDRFVVKVDILPLLKKHISVGTFVLDGFSANFTRKKDGTFENLNIAHFQEAQKTTTAKATQKEKPEFTFGVDKVAIKNFNLYYKDEMLNLETRIKDLNVNSNYSALTNAFSNSMSLNLFFKNEMAEFDLPIRTKGTLKLTDDYQLRYLDAFIRVGDFLKADIENDFQKMDVLKVEDAEIIVSKLTSAFPFLKEYKLGGKISVDMKYYFETHQGKGDIVFEKITAFAQGYHIQDLSGTIKGEKRRFVSEDMSLTVNENTFSMPFTLRETPNDLNLDLQINSNLVMVDKLLVDSPKKDEKKSKDKDSKDSAKSKKSAYDKPVNIKISSDIKKLEGKKLTANGFDLNGDIKNINNLDKANGYMKFFLDTGILNVDELHSNGMLMKVIMMPIKILDTIKLIKIPDLKNLIYNSASGDFVFNDGVMTINNMDFLSKDLSNKTTGTVNFQTQQLDLLANTYLSELGKSEPIEVKITGSINDPKVNMNALSVVKGITKDNRVVEGAGDVTHKTVDELKKGLEKINIFK